MSSKVLNSRYAERRRLGRRPASSKSAAAEEAASGPLPEAEPRTLGVRFGFVTMYGRPIVIELSEEAWGGRRYYVAALSEDPSICVKAADGREALIALIRHLRRSPTIKRFFFDRPPAYRQQRRLQSLLLGR